MDKTAKRSLDKRRFVTEQLEKDEKEIHHIEDQIARINERFLLKAFYLSWIDKFLRYLPLCAHLKESKEHKENLAAMLEQCLQDEQRVCISTANNCDFIY